MGLAMGAGCVVALYMHSADQGHIDTAGYRWSPLIGSTGAVMELLHDQQHEPERNRGHSVHRSSDKAAAAVTVKGWAEWRGPRPPSHALPPPPPKLEPRHSPPSISPPPETVTVTKLAAAPGADAAVAGGAARPNVTLTTDLHPAYMSLLKHYPFQVHAMRTKALNCAVIVSPDP